MQIHSNLKTPELKELELYSKELGTCIGLVQGSGGNTSIKISNQLWIKGSGKKLRDALNEDIFLPLDLQVIRHDIASKKLESNKSALLPNFNYSGLRASIETGLHAIINHKIVVHLHPINIISLLVRKNAENELRKLFDLDSYIFMPYIKPGHELTEALFNISNSKKLPKIIFLANHGLVVAGDTIKEIKKILESISKKIPDNHKITDKVKFKGLHDLVRDTEWRLPIYKEVHLLALNSTCFKRAIAGILCPDHVVFLGNEIYYAPHEEADKLKIWLQQPQNKNLPYIILPGQGVITNPNLSQDGHELLLAWCKTLIQIPENAEINYLQNEQIDVIHNWEAEKYRLSLSTKKK
jgi:rhamnose utilization protein RhaD (predicted bifunctional aldolase and dehydrogenase)